jgi:hypothetical protein
VIFLFAGPYFLAHGLEALVASVSFALAWLLTCASYGHSNLGGGSGRFLMASIRRASARLNVSEFIPYSLRANLRAASASLCSRCAASLGPIVMAFPNPRSKTAPALDSTKYPVLVH